MGISWVLSMEGEPGGWGSGGVAETSTEAEEPRDVRVVRELLRSMVIGDGDYEPRVMHQFLQPCYRYVVDVLTDARVYSDHAGKPAIDPDDVRLAIQSKHRAQLTKSMKFKDGYMISSGQPVKEYIDYVVQHVSRQCEDMVVVERQLEAKDNYSSVTLMAT